MGGWGGGCHARIFKPEVLGGPRWLLGCSSKALRVPWGLVLSPGVALGSLVTSLGGPWAAWGVPWEIPGGSWRCFGSPWGPLGVPRMVSGGPSISWELWQIRKIVKKTIAFPHISTIGGSRGVLLEESGEVFGRSTARLVRQWNGWAIKCSS